MVLKTKLERLLFAIGIVVAFFTIHFTDVISYNGLSLDELLRQISGDPLSGLVYIAMLTVPALVAAVLIAKTVSWVKAGK